MNGVGLLDSRSDVLVICLMVVLPLVAGALSAASWLTARNANARRLATTLAPYRAALGTVALAVGAFQLLAMTTTVEMRFSAYWKWGWYGFAYLLVTLGMIATGFFLGMPLLARLVPGDLTPQERALEMQRKLVAWEVPVGVATCIAAFVVLLSVFGVVRPG